ncbi:MAG: hypothetical protein GYA23_05215 [Methanomicrobiales archaeon]|nr:hypothetical protein [Methanomicrobiales archaeon]
MNSIHVPATRRITGGLVILLIVAVLMTALLPGVLAIDEDIFKDWTLHESGKAAHVDIIPPFPLPDSIPLTKITGESSTTDGCPIGAGKAPHLANPLEVSGSLCRGACGPDCPEGRCTKLPMIIIENDKKTGTCRYTNVIRCPTHVGCQAHDACYDYCEDRGHDSIWDSCHLQCNQRCYDAYGRTICIPWADIGGKAGTLGSTTVDFWLNPQYTSSLTFSDAPVFTPYDESYPTPTPTVAATTQARTETPVTSPTTLVPKTTVTTKGTPVPEYRLTVLMAGDLTTADLEGTTIGWEPEATSQSCSSGGGGAQCVLKFPSGTAVSVAAFPGSGILFTGWSGSCSGSGDCTVVMTADKTVTALFKKTAVTTAINYQDYCTNNYPGSTYDAETESCVFNRDRPTITSTLPSGGGGPLVLIPLTGGCCPGEPCTTQVATASGGTPPYSFTPGSFSAAPPMGMIVDINGYLTGTAPAEMKPYTFNVCVKDMAGQEDCGTSSMVVS